MAEDAARANRLAAQVMNQMAAAVKQSGAGTGMEAFGIVKGRFDQENDRLKKLASATREKLEHMFAFAEEAFPEGQELLILVTELSVDPDSARFIAGEKKTPVASSSCISPIIKVNASHIVRNQRISQTRPVRSFPVLPEKPSAEPRPVLPMDFFAVPQIRAARLQGPAAYDNI